MLPTLGLRTHIWNTGLRSILLLAGFPVLLVLIAWSGSLLVAAGGTNDFFYGLRRSFQMLPAAFGVALVVTAVWFLIAWFANQKILDLASGAHAVTRTEEPALWNAVEELAISRGMRMPRLAVIETEAMNAYASGLQRDQGAVTVTRGLLQGLGPRELRAVLAHELTHIRNGDARLAVIAAVFAGVISLIGELLWRGMGRRNGGFRIGGSSRSSSSSDRKGGGAGWLIVIALAVAALAWLLSVALRMALSRNREFLADAGAVEMTADPDAMVSALRKISGQSAMPELPAQMRAMLLDDAANSLGPRWFATHPPIDERIEALKKFAGALDLPPLPALPEPDATVVRPPPGAPSGALPRIPGLSPPGSPWSPRPPSPPAPG